MAGAADPGAAGNGADAATRGTAEATERGADAGSEARSDARPKSIQPLAAVAIATTPTAIPTPFARRGVTPDRRTAPSTGTSFE